MVLTEVRGVVAGLTGALVRAWAGTSSSSPQPVSTPVRTSIILIEDSWTVALDQGRTRVG